MKSTSRTMRTLISSTISASEANFTLGTAFSISLVAQCNTFKSVYRIVSTPGFCTLITTFSPLTNFAAWTCAIEADANGVSSIEAKISSKLRPANSEASTCCT